MLPKVLPLFHTLSLQLPTRPQENFDKREQYKLSYLSPLHHWHSPDSVSSPSVSTMAAMASFPSYSSFGTPNRHLDQLNIHHTATMSLRRSGCYPKYSQHSTPSLCSFQLDPKVDTLLDSVKWDDKGLVVAIAQNLDTGAIMMQGFANREALATTISSRKATFFSRSRSSLWTKGETSSNFIHVHDIFLDCDRDSVIYLGTPDGPTCHTGAETCYYVSISDVINEVQTTENHLALTTLYSLENTISRRRDVKLDGKPSWTKRLLSNQELLCSKVREEAEELVQTLLGNENRTRVASEMADLLYHAMVLLSARHVKMEEVLEVLRKRFSQSGIQEKDNRKGSSSKA